MLHDGLMALGVALITMSEWRSARRRRKRVIWHRLLLVNAVLCLVLIEDFNWTLVYIAFALNALLLLVIHPRIVEHWCLEDDDDDKRRRRKRRLEAAKRFLTGKGILANPVPRNVG